MWGKRVTRVLANRSGASLMFILAIMLLLMAIGASAMAAASANMGVRIEKQEQNQINLYADSMERTIKASLEGIVGDRGKDIINGTLTSLGGQILKDVYMQAAAGGTGMYSPGGVTGYSFSQTVTDATYTIEVKGDFFVAYTAHKPYTPNPSEDQYIRDADGTIVDTILKGQNDTTSDYRVKQEASITGGELFVTVYTTYKGKTIISQTTYFYENGYIGEENFSKTDESPTIGRMLLDSAGSWEVMLHEKIDL